jgi:hypothetical protein
VFSGDECGSVDGCGWDKTKEQCVKVYDFHPMDCGEHWDEHTCAEEKGCSWAAQATICHTDGEDIPCDKFFTDEGCVMNSGCIWNDDATRCHDDDHVLSCDNFYSDSTCQTQPGCSWDGDSFHCLVTGTKIGCDKMYEESSCTQAGCNWNIELYACHGHDELLACERFYDKKWCDERDDCKFEAQRCMNKDYVIPCNEQTQSKGCADAGCTWHSTDIHTNPGGEGSDTYHESSQIAADAGGPGSMGGGHEMGMCGHADAPICDFIYDEQKCSPRRTKVCGWDARLHKCRKLLNKDEL